ncbi:MAG: exo-alpha-sialidase [Acidobacteria bacterium]|nr:exo-alpha-sialidase [Acidobacteriota bacterium]
MILSKPDRQPRHALITTLALSAVLALAMDLAVTAQSGKESGKVAVVRTPHSGLQPQAVMDGSGTLHLIYFKGEPGAGDVFYVVREPGKESFSSPIRVNSRPGSVIATGTIRGAHLAVGRHGRVHVSWMGSQTAEPKGPGGATPMLYARLNDAGTAFESQRNVMQFAAGLDGGGSIAADSEGNVYAAWHAHGGPKGEKEGEADRRIWIARSTDDGRTFAREAVAYAERTGACGCCGMRAFADRRGAVYVLYRAATDFVDRDMYLLSSTDRGQNFRGLRLHQWKLDTCPMSSAVLAEADGRVLAAWETAGQVYYTGVNPPASGEVNPISAPGEGKGRKHPAIAGNMAGETILVWTEGMGWKKGGSLAWQVFDRDGKPTGEKGTADGVPVWSLPSVVASPGGGFTIIY